VYIFSFTVCVRIVIFEIMNEKEKKFGCAFIVYLNNIFSFLIEISNERVYTYKVCIYCIYIYIIYTLIANENRIYIIVFNYNINIILSLY
jgi:hypothetical protein